MSAMLYRISGILLILSSLLGFLGQIFALALWEGYYLFGHHLIGDLGVSACEQIRDDSGPRYICSPGHDWFNYGTALSGILLLIGAVVLVAAGRETGPAEKVAGFYPVGVALIISGITMSVVGFFPSDVNAPLHDAAATTRVLATWVAMVTATWVVGGAVAKQQMPILHGSSRILSLILLLVSVGAFALLFSGGGSTPGLYQRLSFEVLSVWTILLGAVLYRVPGRGQREEKKRRQREQFRAAQQERDEAVRKAVENLEGN